VVLAAPSHPRATREGERLHGRKRERRQGCQRLDRERRRGKTTPTLGTLDGTPSDDRSHEWLASFWIRRSGLGRRETLGPPVKSRRAQTLRGAHAVKAAEAMPGTHEVRVHAVSFRVAEVDRTHRASCPPGGQKPRGGCESKQGASQKEARSTA